MEIMVDKRIELMAVIQTMDNYWDGLVLKYSNKNLFKCEYKENVDNYFNKYKNHGTVKLYNELCNNVQDISAFINLALCYSNPPNFDNIANIGNNINGLIKQNIPYENFINGIKCFYEETNFEYFFGNNQTEYEMLINDYINKNDLKEYVNKVDIYLGSNTNNYTIAVSALLMGCFGIKILSNENIIYNYSIISPFDYKENKYIFGSKFSVLELLWHEICHLTINDLTKNNISQFNISCIIISNDLIKHFYTDIETIVNEYIIRAITIRLFEINYGEKTTENLIQDNIQKGFTEIESIRNYISKNCEKNNKFTSEEGYKELMDYVIKKI
ncbi:MAG: DUF4932 domain-containing protein [Treponema sp.]|jgi:hypothetical protein|nr:DUF4932 domain-containing protein [Treponema sp.]